MALVCVIACGASDPPDQAPEPTHAPVQAGQLGDIPTWRIIGLERYVPPPQKPAEAAADASAPVPAPSATAAPGGGSRRGGPGPVTAEARRKTPLPYQACPALALSSCLGGLPQSVGSAKDILSAEQVKTLRRCDRDIYPKPSGPTAGALFGAASQAGEREADGLGGHCAPDSLARRAAAAAQDRLAP